MNCCICGTVRNCGPYLEKIFSNMEIIGNLFNDYKIIIYYDNSSDDTLDKLKDYQKKNDKMQFYENKGKLLEFRTHRIALGRNMCLNFIRKQYSHYPYFIMMDCDDRCARDINSNVLKDYLKENSWDCLTFNYPGSYYDSWALSKIPYVLSCHHFKNSDACQKMITNLINNSPPNKLIRCLSAFNGIAIYRTQKFINCYYDGHYRTNYIPNWMKNIHIKMNPNIIPVQDLEGGLRYEDCEHRHFHIQAILKNSARIRISPKCLFI
jgi:hypothetical protein